MVLGCPFFFPPSSIVEMISCGKCCMEVVDFAPPANKSSSQLVLTYRQSQKVRQSAKREPHELNFLNFHLSFKFLKLLFLKKKKTCVVSFREIKLKLNFFSK